MLAAVAATATLAGVSPASAQDAAPAQQPAAPAPQAPATAQPVPVQPAQATTQTQPPSNATNEAAAPPANPVGAATATTPNAAQTQNALNSAQVGDIVVTARLKSENIQKVPETIVAITPETLKNNQITDFYQLQGFAPSVDVSTGYGKDFTGVLIRGFGTSTLFSEVPAQPSSLYDIANVQFLYGPQGTLFGYTALGGAVLYTPAHPQMNAFHGGIDVTEGNLGTNNVQGFINIPIVNDRLALRIAGARNRTDGYIQVQGTGTKLDSNESESIRIGLQYNSPGNRFTDYTLLQINHQHATATAQAVSFYNPLGGWAGANDFSGVCTADILAKVWAPGTTSDQCQAQHAAVLKSFTQQAQAAVALTKSSRGYAVPAPNENAPLIDPINTNLLETIANWDAIKWHGALGGGSISFHNIADVTWFKNIVTNFTVGAFDYYGSPDGNGAFGTKLVLPTPRPSQLLPGSTTNPTDGFGAPSLPGFNVLYHDEFQIHGTLDDDLGTTPGLTYVIGFYNSIQPSSPLDSNPTSQNLPISFDGAFSPNEGPAPSYYLINRAKFTSFGQYVNLIGDLGALYLPLKGIQLTGGIRFNENKQTLSYYNYSIDYTAPNVFARTDPFTGTGINTVYRNKPVNYSGALNYVTDKNDLYFNYAHIIVPGFANAALQTGITPDEVPGYVANAKPEVLNDYEVGDKWRFNFNGIRGYLDFDVYYETFKDVQVAETIFIPSLNGGTYATYTGNPAAEKRKGIEVQGEVFPTRRLDLYANFSYTHDYYTTYFAPDPTSTFTAGSGYIGAYDITPGAPPPSPLCVPDKSRATIPTGKTVGTCIFDFSKSPLPFAPTFQLSVRASYTMPLPGKLGDLVGNVTANYISRQFFQGGYSNIPLVREEQLLGPGVADAESSAAHTLINLRLQWTKPFGEEGISAAAFVTNLTDKHYADGSLDFLFATGVATQDFGPPRQYGVEISAKF